MSLGLGTRDTIDRLVVRRPDGREQDVTDRFRVDDTIVIERR